ncbi:MAG: type I restriction-modification system subunit M [Fimbriimonadaceae bacterium]|nr:type I restriction-modification system subunit M [Fimbriimonadaceae bacterium]
MPNYKFKWSNLPPSLLDDLCSQLLGISDADCSEALRSAYGARPDVEFIRDAWPILLESWLAKNNSALSEVVRALAEARGEKDAIKGRRAQLAYLRGLRNSKNLRTVVWGQLIAAGEVDSVAAVASSLKSAAKPHVSVPTRRTKKMHVEADSKSTNASTTQKKPEEEKALEVFLWEAADRLRSRVDAAEYKHVVLGLIFLKYISDVFAKRREELQRLVDEPGSDYFMPTDEAKQSVLEDRDEYASEGVFWVPEGHRWEDLRKAAKQADIGVRIDAAMDAIEKENSALRGVLPKNYARRELTPIMLGGLIDTFSRKDLAVEAQGGLDILGRVYEYFLAKFATAEGKLGGEFYTPRSVVRLMVDMLEPFDGRVFDPACGSGGMFVQAEEFVEAHGGRREDIAVFGQEQNPTTWRLAKMNLALRGIEANLGPEWADAFTHDLHPDLRADFILTNPPFNVSEWGGERLRDDPRWQYGIPPSSNANFAWIQHMLAHLSPVGTMVTVMANGSLTAEQSGQDEIRKKLVEADLVECIVSLPKQLFYTTQIEVCLWFLTRDKSDRPSRARKSLTPRRERHGELLFIDARELGHMVSKTNRELSSDEIDRIAGAYKAWRGKSPEARYQDILGFCAAVKIDTVREQRYVLTPGRYVGSATVDIDDDELIGQKIARLRKEIEDGFASRALLQERVAAALNGLQVGSID